MKMKQELKVLSDPTPLPSLKFNTSGLKSVLESLKSVGVILMKIQNPTKTRRTLSEVSGERAGRKEN